MKIKWYLFILAFFAGVFLVNSLPHFINGISGNHFPTPFANPPGKGLSSSTLNVIWGGTMFLTGFVFLYFSKAGMKNIPLLLTVFAGGFLMAIRLSIVLIDKLPPS